MERPYSQSCDNNKAPILAVLQRVFDQSHCVLEIGSGTGQHAVYMAPRLPHLQWQPTDRELNLPGIRQWCDDFPADNIKKPLVFDIHRDAWPVASCDAVFSANTAHIMPWEVTALMIKRVAEALPTGGIFALYGPFNYSGHFTCESNEQFDSWLKQQNPQQGIRHFEEVNEIAAREGLNLFEDNPMPANNRLLVWVKQPMKMDMGCDDEDI